MPSITIQTETVQSIIHVGACLERLEHLVPARDRICIVDRVVADAHAALLPPGDHLYLEGGEGAKTLARVEQLYQTFLERRCDRDTLVVGIGGGALCDLIAFAAATYLRGMRVTLVPTTLLAQVDASLGGKNGVNFGGYKNLVGVIRQPECVICDPRFLGSLTPQIFRHGMAEVIKHAAIGDRHLFAQLETDRERLLALEMATLEQVVTAAIQVKAHVVSADEMERGARVTLNFGHTLGHAIESTCALPHGEAVSIGMMADARLSVVHAGLAVSAVSRLQGLLTAYGLPTTPCGEWPKLREAVRQDKKRHHDAIRLGVLTDIGTSTVMELPLDTVEQFFAREWSDA
ncbi:MAG: 3-dehydroquinate synthase [Deltaproteobacteria bacterium]|nr:3-dehydroquinate synthase [Deltaproteobacteria bacterium]